MIAFLIRSIGLWLVAGAVVAVVIDGMKSIASGRLILTPFLTVWSDLAPASFAAAKAAVPGPVWNTMVPLVLGLPAWAVLVVLGAALIALGTRRRRSVYMA